MVDDGWDNYTRGVGSLDPLVRGRPVMFKDGEYFVDGEPLASAGPNGRKGSRPSMLSPGLVSDASGVKNSATRTRSFGSPAGTTPANASIRGRTGATFG
jgi:hypothetical protein